MLCHILEQESQAGAGSDVRATYCRHQQLVDFLHGSFELDLSTILSIFYRDQDVQVFIQVFPVGLAAVLLLLGKKHGR